MDTGDAGGVRLDLAQLVAFHPTNPWHAVRLRPPLELAQTVELRPVERHDELPAFAQRQPTFGAVGAQELDAAAAETRLERSRRVVDPRVDHAAVVTRLVEPDVRLLLEHRDCRVRAGLRNPPRDGEADDASADNPNLHR